MYTEKDFESIDDKNFTASDKTATHIILKSNSTGHFWDVECRELRHGQQQLVISHRHNETDPFHRQPNMHPKTVAEAMEMIKKHDDWFLEKKTEKKKRSAEKRN